MKFAGSVFIVIIGGVGIAAGLGVTHYARPAHLAKITMTSALSEYVQAEINTVLECQHGISFKPAQVLDVVAAAFPALEKITVYKKKQSYTVTVAQQRPLALINQQQVVTDRGYIVPKDRFEKKTVDQLFSYTTQESLVSMAMYPEHAHFARTFDTDLLAAYSVVWVTPSRVELIDKQDQKVRMIIASSMSLPDDFDKAYQEIKKELQKLPAKKGRVWQVDMRFKNQILVC